MGGFFGGLLVGAVVVVCVGTGVSLLMPLPIRPEVSADDPSVNASQGADGNAEVTQPGPDADLVELAPRAPDSPADTGEGGVDSSVTQPADKPVVTEDTEAPADPVTAEAPVVDSDVDAPVVQAESVTVPTSPEVDSTPSVATDVPSQPQVPGTEENADLNPPAPDESTPDASEQADTEIVATETPVPVEPPQQERAPEPDTAPDTSPDRSAQAPDEQAEPEEAPADERLAALPRVGEEGESGSGPSIGTPVVPLTERYKTPAANAGSGSEVGEMALETYAQAFENTENKPMMSIILIDDAEALGVEALQDFPYPLSFAVDPTEAGAAEKMARHRAAGFEVVALANLPSAATAQDAEVSMSVWLEALPETVAVLEGTKSGIQGNRELSGQVSAIAGGTGRGLITQNNGLNTVQKLAARDGVPSAVVFRDFDGAGQTPTVMRRFLDQAAFRAGQEGAVVMLGRVRPDTISALLLWGLQDRASRVALAPVSAVLKQSVSETLN